MSDLPLACSAAFDTIGNKIAAIKSRGMPNCLAAFSIEETKNSERILMKIVIKIHQKAAPHGPVSVFKSKYTCAIKSKLNENEKKNTITKTKKKSRHRSREESKLSRWDKTMCLAFFSRYVHCIRRRKAEEKEAEEEKRDNWKNSNIMCCRVECR